MLLGFMPKVVFLSNTGKSKNLGVMMHFKTHTHTHKNRRKKTII